MWDRGRVGKQLVRGGRCIPINTDEASREVFNQNAIKELVCRMSTLKSHPTGTGRIKHAIRLGSVGSVGLDCHSSKIQHWNWTWLDGRLEALSGWEGEGFMI